MAVKRLRKRGTGTNYTLTGDHGEPESSRNFFGVTGRSFTLGLRKTEEGHFAEACTGQCLEVAQ